MSDKVTIKFFASLREELDCEITSLDITNDVKTVADVKNALVAIYPNWETALSNGKLLNAVNHNMVSSDHSISADDEIAFFPPVTGG
ncbi:molybdopterin synthase sulfur carrier subunit [Thalassotalea loyana]|uniref:Molybdopterin synthase sulfur carrier subunit n=1 Tax=Thalassotalea loyana TaxID=280483 RepID=A0ABQ6HED7_9GAMM|nr:molybdopterin converting factor subunit 1 [Thalassotalea loyana]GLX85246.1 molybdopterin synthase sulfur carrier subunit [Thalassotalea loyana]